MGREVSVRVVKFPSRRARWALAALGSLAFVGLPPLASPGAEAVFPGANGKMAFTSLRSGDFEVFVMNADGSGQTNLTNTTALDSHPSWSPDGTRIAFNSDRDGNFQVYVMNADGSGQTNLTSNPANDSQPAWSPDGARIAFATDRDGNAEVYVMNADGSEQARLTSSPATDFEPNWQTLSPFPKKVSLKATPKKVEKGERIRLRARISPCEGHQGDVVEFYRKKKRLDKKKSTDHCVAKLKVKVTKTTKFRAVSPQQDFDHLAGTSDPVKVRALRR